MSFTIKDRVGSKFLSDQRLSAIRRKESPEKEYDKDNLPKTIFLQEILLRMEKRLKTVTAEINYPGRLMVHLIGGGAPSLAPRV